MTVDVQPKANLEETSISSQHPNMTLSPYSMKSRQPQGLLSSSAWHWAAHQDFPLSRNASQGYKIPYDIRWLLSELGMSTLKLGNLSERMIQTLEWAVQGGG